MRNVKKRVYLSRTVTTKTQQQELQVNVVELESDDEFDDLNKLENRAMNLLSFMDTSICPEDFKDGQQAIKDRNYYKY